MSNVPLHVHVLLTMDNGTIFNLKMSLIDIERVIDGFFVFIHYCHGSILRVIDEVFFFFLSTIAMQ